MHLLQSVTNKRFETTIHGFTVFFMDFNNSINRTEQTLKEEEEMCDDRFVRIEITCFNVIGFPPITSNENDSESFRAGLLANSFPR